ncbi:MAG: EAL domain-containing protein [Actinobacteria bacterium]|nr:EAL domain-containing protein [Actinomycetota bacterium]
MMSDTTTDAGTRAGTERLTFAWLVALVAIAIVVVAGAALTRSVLNSSQASFASVTDVAAQRADAERVTALTQRLTDITSPDTAEQIAVELEEIIQAIRERALLLERRADATVPTTLRLVFEDAQVGTAALTSMATEVVADPSLAPTRSPDIATTNTSLQDDLGTLEQTLRSRAMDDGQQAKWVNLAVLAGVLLLLLIEGVLVLLPATRRVREVMERRRQQQEVERERTRGQLERLARFDHLTGLANRALFRERLEHALAAAERSGKLVGVMFLDLDRFKEVNDQFGHDVGDQLLIEVAARLQGCARRTDTVARLGGDEFTLILENLETADGAATVAQKITDSLRTPIPLDDNEVMVTTSIGIAIYPDDGTTIESLIREADSAMYHAKSAGRNTFEFSTPELRASNIRRLDTISALRGSLDRGDLRLVYQPQVEIDSGRVVGVEAFVRWERPDGHDVPAADFIELAEDTDLMVPLGDWVLREVCRQSGAWRDDGLPGLRIAVNLSERQFHHDRLAKTVASILTTSGTDPRLLELEITEDTLVSDVQASSVTLRLLRGIGVRVVIDDFGTGYSSLSYLRSFPIDALKIDRSFVERLGEDEEATVVPAAITGLARHLKLATIAEGVETEQQVAFLRRIRCDVAQGYHFTPPLEADDVTAFVRRRSITTVSEAAADTLQ